MAASSWWIPKFYSLNNNYLIAVRDILITMIIDISQPKNITYSWLRWKLIRVKIAKELTTKRFILIYLCCIVFYTTYHQTVYQLNYHWLVRVLEEGLRKKNKRYIIAQNIISITLVNSLFLKYNLMKTWTKL